MYSIQTQMIRLMENQMDHLHQLNLLLVGEGDEEEVEDGCDYEEGSCDCEEGDCGCDGDDDCVEDCGCDGDDDCDDSVEDVEDEHSDKEDTCATCNRADEKCRCPNPYKLLSKKTQ
jgi:hypothetical protein